MNSKKVLQKRIMTILGVETVSPKICITRLKARLVQLILQFFLKLTKTSIVMYYVIFVYAFL